MRRAPFRRLPCPGSDHEPRRAGTQCIDVPWLLVEAGAASRSLIITAPGCIDSANGLGPDWVVQETRAAIRIRVFAQRPRAGRIEQNCGDYSETTIGLRTPINGRRIEGQNWPAPLRYGLLSDRLPGLPRLLGLSPAQALHALWLEGFRARLAGHGRQVVSQVPGWGLVDSTDRPDPFDGTATVRAGRRIAIPTTPALAPGAPSGVLKGTVSEGKPSAVPVALFDASGRLLARFRAPFRLKLAPGRYLLLADTGSLGSPGPVGADVAAGHTRRVVVPNGCTICSY
jgi:hypothetical protein